VRCVRTGDLNLIFNPILMLLTDRYRRKAHNAAWYDSPNDEPSNLPIALRNPFGKRNYRQDTRNTNEQHLEESGLPHGMTLRPIKTDAQDYRPTTPQERAREFGVEDPKPHSATTPNVDSAHNLRSEKFEIPRSESPLGGGHASDKVERVEEQRRHDPTSDETAVENGVVNRSPLDADNEGTHQRKKDVFSKVTALFNKKSDDNDNDPESKKKPKKVFTPMSQIRATILNSWINVLLIACGYHYSVVSNLTFLAPVGIALYYAHVKPVAVFVVNFIAIIPLAAMLSYATEEIAYRTGETIGGLLNASFG
jgi:Ca2+:H+ antiporter